MDQKDEYQRIHDAYRAAHQRLMTWAALLRDVGIELLAQPESMVFKNAPERSGGPLGIVMGGGKLVEGSRWPTADDINRAVIARVEARLACERAYAQLSDDKRRSAKKPSDVIET